MNFNDTPEEAVYRAQVRAWLSANAPKGGAGGFASDEDPAGMAVAKAWQAKKADNGYACITWPKEWGGAGGASWQSMIFGQEESKVETPGNPFAIGLGMCVPTVMTSGNEADKQRFVGPAARGEPPAKKSVLFDTRHSCFGVLSQERLRIVGDVLLTSNRGGLLRPFSASHS